jgi:hypothetical protein
MRKLLFPAALFFLSTGFEGCPYVQVSVDVSEVCVTRHDVTIDATDGTHATGSFTIDDFGDVTKFAKLDGDMQFRRVQIRPHGALPSVSSARVAIASGDASSTLPSLELACDGDCEGNDQDIYLPADLQANAVDYVLSGSMAIDIDVEGQLPTTAWTADIDVCMTGSFGDQVPSY